MSRILADFSGLAPVQVASWMESPNAYLAGRRPRELVGQAPEDVVAALAKRRLGGLHG